jgi:hypothetical protein
MGPHWGAEANDVPVRVDDYTLVLSPLSVLRNSDIGSGQSPRLSQLVGVFDE